MLLIAVAVEDAVGDFSSDLAYLAKVCATPYPRIGSNHGMITNINGSLDGGIRGNGSVLAYINWPFFGIKYTTRFNPAVFANKYLIFIE